MTGGQPLVLPLFTNSSRTPMFSVRQFSVLQDGSSLMRPERTFDSQPKD